MLITLVDLEREPVSFDLRVPPGAIDYGDEATQIGDLVVEGKAELLREHRGPKEIVPDIRTRAAWKGEFEVPLAATSTSSSAPWGSTPAPPTALWARPKLKSVIIRRTVLCSKTFSASRCC
jgi:hypothetical protein